MRVLLVQPDPAPSLVGFTRLARPEPLALELLAGALTEHEVKILDLRVESSPTTALADTIAEFVPDVVGVTGYTTDVPRMQEILNEVKRFDRSIYTVAGGHHASLCPEDFDSDTVDFIVVGEGEVTFPLLLNALERRQEYRDIAGLVYRSNGHQVFTGPRPPMRSLDDSPLPDREATAHYREHYWFRFWQGAYTMESARGCPYRCNFCSVWKFYQGKCRLKSVDRVAEELATLPGQFVAFVDDNFLQSLPRAQRLFERVKDLGLKKRFWIQARSDSIARRPDLVEKWASVGLSTVLVGLEGFREEDLTRVNKSNSVKTNEKAVEILHKNDVDIWGAFLVDPSWLRSDFDALINYVRNLKITFPQFTVLTPLPGTDLFRESVHQLITRNFARFDFLHSVLPTRLPTEEFYENMARLYASTTLSLSELREKIRRGHIDSAQLKSIRGLMQELTNPRSYLVGS